MKEAEGGGQDHEEDLRHLANDWQANSYCTGVVLSVACTTLVAAGKSAAMEGSADEKSLRRTRAANACDIASCFWSRSAGTSSGNQIAALWLASVPDHAGLRAEYAVRLRTDCMLASGSLLGTFVASTLKRQLGLELRGRRYVELVDQGDEVSDTDHDSNGSCRMGRCHEVHRSDDEN